MTARSSNDPIRQQLRLLKELGFGFLGEVPDLPAEAAAAPPPQAAPPKRTQAEPHQPPKPAPDRMPERAAIKPRVDLPMEDRVEALARIAEEVAACKACRLCHGRTNTVPGEGNPKARLMFVGEGPGQTEDELGRPFVGAAGDLLTKIIGAMTLSREEVFIANVVKCRPPGNRKPEADEMEACVGYLERQVDAIAPEIIVALGKTAVEGLLPQHRRTQISKMRGQWLDFRGVPVMPTFHPAYLLRNPAGKRPVWDDMQLVMAELGLKIPGK